MGNYSHQNDSILNTLSVCAEFRTKLLEVMLFAL